MSGKHLPCHYCGKVFPCFEDLGRHHNAHRRERQELQRTQVQQQNHDFVETNNLSIYTPAPLTQPNRPIQLHPYSYTLSTNNYQANTSQSQSYNNWLAYPRVNNYHPWYNFNLSSSNVELPYNIRGSNEGNYITIDFLSTFDDNNDSNGYEEELDPTLGLRRGGNVNHQEEENVEELDLTLSLNISGNVNHQEEEIVGEIDLTLRLGCVAASNNQENDLDLTLCL